MSNLLESGEQGLMIMLGIFFTIMVVAIAIIILMKKRSMSLASVKSGSSGTPRDFNRLPSMNNRKRRTNVRENAGDNGTSNDHETPIT